MERSGPGDAPDHGARGAPPSEQAASGPGAQQSQLRAVPCGLEAYPSLQAAFAAPQPSNTHGLQKHGSTVQARVRGREVWRHALASSPFPPLPRSVAAAQLPCILPDHLRALPSLPRCSCK